jgi:hypothetical protein
MFVVGGSSGARLRFGSTARWNAIRNEVHALHGWWPEVTSAGDGFRTLERQEELFLRNYTTANTGTSAPKSWQGRLWWRKTPGTPSAATPGTSNHGYGTTVDVENLGGIGNFSTTRYRQFAEVAARHGYSNAEGRRIDEPWHWSDTLDPDDALGAQAPEETEDMALAPDERQWLQETHAALGAGGAVGLPAPATVLGRLVDVQGNVTGVPGVLAAARQEIAAVKADTASIKGTVATIKSNTTGVPEAFVITNGKVDAVKADTGVIRTDVAVIKGGVATLLERPAAGAEAPAAPEGGAPVTLTDADVDRIADAVLARFASLAVTVTPTTD